VKRPGSPSALSPDPGSAEYMSIHSGFFQWIKFFIATDKTKRIFVNLYIKHAFYTNITMGTFLKEMFLMKPV
jgi:hypothetical protein